MKAALFLCSKTGVIAEPWANAGIECWCVDIQHSIRKPRKEGLINYVWGDVRSWCPPSGLEIVFVGAFPPCTDVAVSGARDFKTKRAPMLADALNLFAACEAVCSWSQAPFFIENPVGVLSSHIRKPDYSFDPWQYGGYLEPPGDAYTKRTHLWTGNGFVMPEFKPTNQKPTPDIWKMSPSSDRGDRRSVTPKGFAQAVFEVNKP